MPAIALLSGTASRSRARRALRLRSPRETPLRSDTDVLLLRVGSEPEQRIRRTSSRLRPARKTTYYAAGRGLCRGDDVSRPGRPAGAVRARPRRRAPTSHRVPRSPSLPSGTGEQPACPRGKLDQIASVEDAGRTPQMQRRQQAGAGSASLAFPTLRNLSCAADDAPEDSLCAAARSSRGRPATVQIRMICAPPRTLSSARRLASVRSMRLPERDVGKAGWTAGTAEDSPRGQLPRLRGGP